MAKITYLGLICWVLGFWSRFCMITKVIIKYHQRKLNMGRIWVHLCALLCQYLEPNMLGTLTTFKNCNSLFKKSEIIFTNDIQHIYGFSHKLVSLKTNGSLHCFFYRQSPINCWGIADVLKSLLFGGIRSWINSTWLRLFMPCT